MRQAILILAAALLAGCAADRPKAGKETDGKMTELRGEMVATQIEAQGIRDPQVLRAMRTVPRHLFVPLELRSHSYEDRPLPIGEGQTISQPYIVALMTELTRVKEGAKILEVGTGSGYQAAVLAEMGAEVFTIEIIPTLAARAKEALGGAGYRNIHYRVGDGYAGWPEAAPFDAVVVTAAPGHVPQPLIDQLKVGGLLIIPVGTSSQYLEVITRTEGGTERQEVTPVRFVPMTGKAQQQDRP